MRRYHSPFGAAGDSEPRVRFEPETGAQVRKGTSVSAGFPFYAGNPPGRSSDAENGQLEPKAGDPDSGPQED